MDAQKQEPQAKRPRACYACQHCGNYGYGCQDPISEAELEEYRETEAIGYNARPDCYEKE